MNDGVDLNTQFMNPFKVLSCNASLFLVSLLQPKPIMARKVPLHSALDHQNATVSGCVPLFSLLVAPGIVVVIVYLFLGVDRSIVFTLDSKVYDVSSMNWLEC